MSIYRRAYKYADEKAQRYDSPDSEVIFNTSFENYVRIAKEQADDDIELFMEICHKKLLPKFTSGKEWAEFEDYARKMMETLKGRLEDGDGDC